MRGGIRRRDGFESRGAREYPSEKQGRIQMGTDRFMDGPHFSSQLDSRKQVAQRGSGRSGLHGPAGRARGSARRSRVLGAAGGYQELESIENVDLGSHDCWSVLDSGGVVSVCDPGAEPER